ncbi:MAG: substrate-binding domain-containing protein, partial [Aestuariivirga sp.]
REGEEKKQVSGLERRMGVCGAFAMNAMAFCLPAYFGMPADFVFAPWFDMIAAVSATLAMLVGGSYFIEKAWRSLRAGALHIDTPIALGIIAASDQMDASRFADYVIMGELSNQAAVMRTKDIDDVIATPECSFIKIIDKQTSNWRRDEAQNLMTNWLSTGTAFDGVIANNDESAIGAIQAMKAANVDMKSVVVGGVDATQDALAAMQGGDLDATVFQDAAGQGAGALDAALKLAKGEAVEQKVYIPFKLVTPANIGDFLKKN